MWFDIGHVCERLDWRPRWSNEEMLVQSYEWFVANRGRTDIASASPHRRTATSRLLDAVKWVMSRR